MESFLTNCHTTTKKQQSMHDVISNKLESFYNLLQTTKESLSDENKFQKIQTLQEQTKKLHFQKAQKEFQSSLLKLGKEIDKKFKQDVSVIYQPDAFSNKQKVIQNTLAVHFIRQGQFKLCEDFLNEAGIPIDSELRDAVEKLKNDIEQMHTILNQIETDKDLTLAIEYIKIVYRSF
jgi:phage-related holin